MSTAYKGEYDNSPIARQGRRPGYRAIVVVGKPPQWEDDESPTDVIHHKSKDQVELVLSPFTTRLREVARVERRSRGDQHLSVTPNQFESLLKIHFGSLLEPFEFFLVTRIVYGSFEFQRFS